MYTPDPSDVIYCKVIPMLIRKKPVFILAVLAVCVLLSTVPVLAASTQVHVVKYASDGTTVLSEQTLTYQQMRDTLPVLGDGTTHYYHQGPVFLDDPDPVVEQQLRWNPEEDINLLEKDMGAVRGTNVKVLCDLVGGMSAGETIRVKAIDGFLKYFAYDNVYGYSAREGPIGLVWEKNGLYPDTGYSDGMRLVWFADASTNPWGVHAFGNQDWHDAAAEEYWYYYVSMGESYPTTTGLSVQDVSEIAIFSDDPAPTPPAAGFTATMNTVTNPGFESGTLSGWAQSNASVANTIAHTGIYSAKLYSAKGSVSYIQQSLDLTNIDQITYYYRIDQAATGYLDVYIDSTKVTTFSTVAPWTAGTIDVSSYSGTHTIRFSARSGTSKTNKITAYIDDAAALREFPSGVTGYPPLAVTFRDTTTNNPTTWAWTFGDGCTSSAQNPFHTFTMPGSYAVSLTASNADGSDTETKAGFVTVNGYAPVAAFTGSPTSGSVPLTVTFIDQSTNTPTAWSWNFGDGGTSTTRNPIHQYTATGTYTVTLTATNAFGSDPETKSGYITVTAAGQAPVAAFTGSPTTGSAPLTVQFTDQSSGSPTSWSWNFGDRKTSTAQNPSHSYTKKGTYTVTLTVTNAYGSNALTKTGYIVVS